MTIKPVVKVAVESIGTGPGGPDTIVHIEAKDPFRINSIVDHYQVPMFWSSKDVTTTNQELQDLINEVNSKYSDNVPPVIVRSR